jgi:hypothetical protein
MHMHLCTHAHTHAHTHTQPNTVALLSQVQTKLDALQDCQAALTDVKIVFWVVTPCYVVYIYQCFRETFCLHFQSREMFYPLLFCEVPPKQ